MVLGRVRARIGLQSMSPSGVAPLGSRCSKAGAYRDSSLPQLTMSHPARATRWFTMFQGASASGAFRFTMFQIKRGAPLWFTMLQDELLHLGK